MKGDTDHKLTSSQRRRVRRKTLKSIRSIDFTGKKENIIPSIDSQGEQECILSNDTHFDTPLIINIPLLKDRAGVVYDNLSNSLQLYKEGKTMESKDELQKSRDDVKAAREAKKLAKQAKKKSVTEPEKPLNQKPIESKPVEKSDAKVKGVDEVDRAKIGKMQESLELFNELQSKLKNVDMGSVPVGDNMTVSDVVNTLKDIFNVAKEVENVTAIVQAMDIKESNRKELTSSKKEKASKKPEAHEKKEEITKEDSGKGDTEGKSKAELKAARRAKQEAQRAAKQAQQEKAQTKPATKADAPAETAKEVVIKKDKSPKPKTLERPKAKSQSSQKCNWFQHLHTEHDKDAFKEIAINSNHHPAMIKLGVQLASHVVTGSNARCIALLDALKKMVRDYTLPAKTEFARGLETQLAASLSFLWRMRAPCASQVNAIKHFRHQLTQLPNNVDEYDAKKKLQEEIDRYIREQIDMAGEAISIAVRNKISNGDNILTYGCSSLIERIFRESHEAGVQYRAVVVGHRASPAAREMLRRLVAAGVTCAYVDISALSFVMKSINKVLLGANALLVNGSVLGAAGTLQAALVARAHNVPVLVACETHKFSDRVQTDAFVYNELGDPDALIDKSDDNSPLKDWRSNPNLSLLNLTYDVTPASLVTAVVTELAILPCTSAPVVLRFKTSEYGM